MSRWCSVKPTTIPRKKEKRYVTSKGYAFIKMPTHHRANGVGYVLEHIVVMEKKLGRKIMVGEGEVHHKDGNRSNNHPDNLELLTLQEHRELHRVLRGNGNEPRTYKPSKKRRAPTGSDKTYTYGKRRKDNSKIVPKDKLPRGHYYMKVN